MEHIARQLAGELDDLIKQYFEADDERRQDTIRAGCEYRVKQLRKEGVSSLTGKYESIVMGLNGHPHYDGDW